MGQIEIRAEQERIAIQIDRHITSVADLWRQYRVLDAQASDAMFRGALARAGLPGGWRSGNEIARPLADQIRRLPVAEARIAERIAA